MCRINSRDIDTSQSTGASLRRVDDALPHVHHQLTESTRIEAAAKRIGMPYRGSIGQFRQRTGMTLTQHPHLERITVAKHSLLATEHSFIHGE